MKKADRTVAPLESIDRLKARKVELDGLDDDLSNLISEFEEAFRSLKLGVRFFVEICARHDWVEELSFAKFEPPKGQGKWRLLRESYAPNGSEQETWSQTPLLDCPREQRFEAVNLHFAGLVDAAVEALGEKVELRQNALSKGKSLLEALRAVKGVAK